MNCSIPAGSLPAAAGDRRFLLPSWSHSKRSLCLDGFNRRAKLAARRGVIAVTTVGGRLQVSAEMLYPARTRSGLGAPHDHRPISMAARAFACSLGVSTLAVLAEDFGTFVSPCVYRGVDNQGDLWRSQHLSHSRSRMERYRQCRQEQVRTERQRLEHSGA